MSGTVTITITYQAGTQPKMDAVKSVLIAADPYWAADYSSESTPRKVVFTIDAAGWPTVAAAITAARRSAGQDGRWLTSITRIPQPARWNRSPSAHGSTGRVPG